MRALIIAFPTVFCDWETLKGIAAKDREREREGGRKKESGCLRATGTTTRGGRDESRGMIASKRVDFGLADSGGE